MGQPWVASDLIDVETYPLHDASDPRRADVVERARAGLADIGAAELPGFLTPDGLRSVLDDAIAVEPLAHRHAGPATAYLGLPDPDVPEGHPRAWTGPSAVEAVAWDLFAPDSPIRWLYEHDPLLDFLGDIIGRGRLHRYADPLGGLNVASMRPGDELQWHFDQTDFVVSLAIRDAEVGGDFEVAPRIRSADDERYEQVAAVLDGRDRSDVVTLGLTPGTLLIFEGRHSLHRVSPVGGSTTRLIALLGYDTEPDTMSSDLLKLVRYGRTEPVTSV